jgi:hypothetical protein
VNEEGNMAVVNKAVIILADFSKLAIVQGR